MHYEQIRILQWLAMRGSVRFGSVILDLISF